MNSLGQYIPGLTGHDFIHGLGQKVFKSYATGRGRVR